MRWAKINIKFQKEQIKRKKISLYRMLRFSYNIIIHKIIFVYQNVIFYFFVY